MNVRGSAAHGPTTATRRSARPVARRAAAGPSRVEQDDRPLGQSRGPGRGSPASRGRPCRPPTTDPSGVQSGSSSPSSTFWVSTRRAARSTSASGSSPRRTLLDQPGAEADGVGQLDVDAGGQRQRPGLVEVRRDPVHRGQERHRPVVGDDRAGEPPLVAQQVGQQPGVGAGRHAVDVGVGVHHRAGPGQRDRHLERRQDDVHQLAPAHRHRTVVAGAAGGGVAGEVLQGGEDPGALQPADVRGARASPPGTGPRRSSPRPAPSGSPARRPAPGRAPGGRRPRPCRGRSRPPSARPGRGRRSPPRRSPPDRPSRRTSVNPVRHSSWTRAGMPSRDDSSTDPLLSDQLGRAVGRP